MRDDTARMTDVRTFGDLLRRHRLEAGLRQEELAERAGLNVRGITHLERGARQEPYRETVRRLAAARQVGRSAPDSAGAAVLLLLHPGDRLPGLAGNHLVRQGFTLASSFGYSLVIGLGGTLSMLFAAWL